MRFFVAFGGMPLGLLGPMIVLRLFILPNFATYTESPAVEIYDHYDHTGEETIHSQMLVYADGTELNLTEKTGQIYSEVPDSSRHREYYKFLWVVEFDNSHYSGLDFLPRN